MRALTQPMRALTRLMIWRLVRSLEGLLGKLRSNPDDGAWLILSRRIHPIGILFPIDVVYLDPANPGAHGLAHRGSV